MNKRILQANIGNQGGAFSLIFNAQERMYPEYVFDYFSPNEFVKNEVYDKLKLLKSKLYVMQASGNKFIKQVKLYKEFEAFLEDKMYDIVHIHTDTAWKATAYLLAAKKTGVRKIIVHSHSSGINGHYRWLNYILHILFRPIVRNAANTRCACSKKSAEWMYNTENDIIFIQNGVDEEKYKFDELKRRRVRLDCGIGAEKIVIGTAGDFSWAKNPEFLEKLIIKLSCDRKYEFLFIGDGVGCADLERHIRKANLSRVCHFIGRVADISVFLNAIDVFLLPSRFEGLPMSAIEAQVNGVYTLVSENVTPEVEISKKFQSIELNVDIWVKAIKDLNLDYDRCDSEGYLINHQVEIGNTVMQLKKIYE